MTRHVFPDARLLAVLLAVLFLVPGRGVAADAVDPDVARLSEQLAVLDRDPALADLAGLERLKARQAMIGLQAARSRDREHALFLANRWVEAAQDAAQAELLLQQSTQLDRERDQITIEASRRDAEMARREADRLRLQSLAREEEAERLAQSNESERQATVATADAATAEAAQARKLADARAKETALARKEAALAAAVAADSMGSEATGAKPASTGKPSATGKPATTGKPDASGLPVAASKPTATSILTPAPSAPPAPSGPRVRPFFTLPGTAFASGKANLTATGQASLQRLADKIGNGSIRVEGHTDSQGSEAANLTLSRQRAEAVRQVLVANGVPAGRIRAIGRGEADPVADNASETGRARNRRVEIIVE